jgi:beta-N-acetylhexosaminidase
MPPESWRPTAGATLLVGLPGPALDRESGERLVRLGPAGVILFRRNLESPVQTQDLLSAIERLLPGPRLLALDQEGGRVSRLEPWVGATPSAATLGRIGPDAARRFGQATAQALAALGFNIDFAPVVDLCAPEAPNGIGARSYSLDPLRVASVAGAFLDGLQEQGVAGCLKHFPGLGATALDSHVALPCDTRDAAEIDRDLLPFRALGSRAASVMVSHASFPALDPTPDLPATLSRPIVTDLLRERLGFAGLIATDDMDMGAVAPRDHAGAAAVAAMRAGCDLILYCADLDAAERAVQALASSAAADPWMAQRLQEAAARVEHSARRWMPRVRPSWDGALATLRQVSSAALA